MSREDVFEKLIEIFKDVFDNEEMNLDDKTVLGEIDGWDSMIHVTLIATIEDEFNIKFEIKDAMNIKNVGQMADLILKGVNVE